MGERGLGAPGGELVEHLDAALVPIDAPNVQKVGTADVVAVAESRWRRIIRDAAEDADDVTRHPLVRRGGVNQLAFLG